MKDILFLAHRLPFPPDRGDKIRSHHILKALAAMAPVHVGCFTENPAELAHVGELESVARSWCAPRRSLPLPLAGGQALLRGQAVSQAAFAHRALKDWVRRKLASGSIGTLYVFSGQMGQYVPDDWHGRLIVDLVDVDSAKFEAYAADCSGPMRWVHAREARLLRAEEARLAARADATILISEAEAALLRSRLPPGSAANPVALGNGIDARFFDPAAVAEPGELGRDAGPHLVFTGQMDYPPNVEAARRMIASILPAIRQRHPGAKFHIVGRAPVAELLRHDGRDGCKVWGEVPDVRPFLAGADLVVAPLAIARGVQNKVLEAMAMAAPVLLTPEAATGIPATDGRHFCVASSDAELTAAACELLEDAPLRRALGAAARRFVLAEMSWPAMLSRLPAIMRGDGDRRDAA